MEDLLLEMDGMDHDNDEDILLALFGMHEESQEFVTPQ